MGLPEVGSDSFALSWTFVLELASIALYGLNRESLEKN